MFVELGSWDDVAVAKFEMFDEEARTIERPVATNADELLINFMVLFILSKASSVELDDIPARCCVSCLTAI